MAKTILYQHRAYYDSFGTGNYTEDKSERFSVDITEEKAAQFIAHWDAIGCKHYETSKAHFYTYQTDARHYKEFILYK